MTSNADYPPPAPIELEWAFSVRIDFTERIQFKTPAGKRSYVPAAGGEIWGPRLQGRVVAGSGADYAGVYGLDAHYMLEASDGSPIYVHNSGYLYALDGSPTATDQPGWGGDKEFYFRITPRFDAPVGPHDWLTRTIILGTGQRHANPDHTVFTYYAVK
ncbi:DUF3237 domain-containing protein [Microbacterium album]|uniref:UPF0311 protein GCM10010921_06500 n=1 Tax=Microbacterium album TaxID=2053191 RepID=A0A917IEW7_9MICO|nr:DUF3237 domain-containing protein [Microbacterium album]GGH36973.1 hypothetical protein GCM10010921_06500 [Microbacterium album]